ncbi:MAG: hypothetical protein WC389_11795 [Lutibacter sp.]|jgi:hypothetical protein
MSKPIPFNERKYELTQSTMQYKYRGGLWAFWSYGYNDFVRTQKGIVITGNDDKSLIANVKSYYPNFIK